MELDLDFVRRQYPVFQRPDLADWAFFENAGGSYVPHQVIRQLDRFFRDHKVQPYGPFESSIAAGAAMDAGYQCIAELLNADVDDVTLGPSTSMNTYVLAQAIRPTLHVGDEIIVTNQDHEANIGCWERLAEFGAVIKRWKIDPDSGELNIDDLRSLVTERTRLVAFNLCSNIVGSMQDTKAITDIVHSVGAIAIADGVSYAPHRIVDVNQLGADVYLFSTYKTFGTHIGVMWIDRKVSAGLICQGHFFNAQSPHYRLNPCGPLHAQIAALAGIGDYFDALTDHHFGASNLSRHARTCQLFELVASHETCLANQLLDALRQHSQLRIIGQDRATLNRRAPTISLVPKTQCPSAIAQRLAKQKVAVRSGHFYARRCVEALGIKDLDEGVLRVSMVHYNTHDDVQRLVDALSETD